VKFWRHVLPPPSVSKSKPSIQQAEGKWETLPIREMQFSCLLPRRFNHIVPTMIWSDLIEIRENDTCAIDSFHHAHQLPCSVTGTTEVSADNVQWRWQWLMFIEPCMNHDTYMVFPRQVSTQFFLYSFLLFLFFVFYFIFHGSFRFVYGLICT
jgi:hypothetical protein